MADTTVIGTERLLLRQYTADDFDALYEIMSDPETMRHYPAPFDADRTRRWIEWNLENYEKYGFGLWAVVLKETGGFIGDCGITLQEIDGETLPEIGYHIHKKYWRRGYAKEAARAARDWFFRHTRYDAVWSYMKYTNEASQATARANGMRKIKEYPDPKNTVSCAWAITRAEWEALKEKEMERRNLKQVFESERISFVEVAEQLIPDYLIMINDIEHVDRFLGGTHDPYTEESEIDWVKENLEKKAPVFSMIEKAGGQFIGNIELMMEPGDDEAELGIAITAAKQDRGFGTEAIPALLAFGFGRLGLKRICLRVYPGNSRAIRVYEKCGFREYNRDAKDVYMEIIK